ncbi:thiol:disulfide interchange protein [Mesoflavibacter sabulilitoris]|uniref:Uncharacterized protein n=1 Tax=Mesoflavibacter zeaxanthinifaciens subsp. sabulilitoris TaxID=1520893 RepID=A0A2T1NAI5_9FLAO|nr:hypothetical protein [Mesoflavibacter zeaxanthinifaciens]MBB3123729.1 thiol:disulfide interchange protein [Mesoflavibacter zeaxanthinifaciens subsp. sabulilitoris]PSG89149.1 hypothetical protein C7H61_09335 [Mesoflavibacter zeaxanthinifaciens subsp. sabulilitoris]
MKNYLELFIAGAVSFVSAFQLSYKHYSEDAGLLDISFTKNDITILLLVTACWLIKLILDKNNPTRKNPDFIDFFGSFLITYILTAGTYAYVIAKNIELGVVLFLMAIFAIFSTDFLKILTEKETQEQFKKSIISVIKSLTDKLNKLIS